MHSECRVLMWVHRKSHPRHGAAVRFGTRSGSAVSHAAHCLLTALPVSVPSRVRGDPVRQIPHSAGAEHRRGCTDSPFRGVAQLSISASGLADQLSGLPHCAQPWVRSDPVRQVPNAEGAGLRCRCRTPTRCTDSPFRGVAQLPASARGLSGLPRCALCTAHCVVCACSDPCGKSRAHWVPITDSDAPTVPSAVWLGCPLLHTGRQTS